MSCHSVNKSEDAVSLMVSETESLSEETAGNKTSKKAYDQYDSEDRRYFKRTDNRRIIQREQNNYYRWDNRRTPPSRSTYYRQESNYSLRNNQSRREENMRFNESRYEPTRNVSRKTMPSRRWQSNEGSWSKNKRFT